MIGVKGLKEIHFDGRGFSKGIESELRGALKQTIKNSKRTRLYNNITGLLRKSSIIKRIGRVGDSVVGTLLNKAPYSGFVHEGTKKMYPRPFLTESLEPELDKLRIKLGDSVVSSWVHRRKK
jgi:hypothetical protein